MNTFFKNMRMFFPKHVDVFFACCDASENTLRRMAPEIFFLPIFAS